MAKYRFGQSNNIEQPQKPVQLHSGEMNDNDKQIRKYLDRELEVLRFLHEASTRLIVEDDINALYKEILNAAISIMHTDMGTMQMFDSNRGQLRLMLSRGFNQVFEENFRWVTIETKTTCGMAMRTGKRIIAEDIETSPYIGQQELIAYRSVNTRSIQTTPLFSRSGQLMGMISTYWKEPYMPTEGQLWAIDVLARQAADLLERSQSEKALREADRRKDEFLATLSHELRNPLTPIKTSLQILRTMDFSKHQTKQIQDILDRQVNHLIHLVDDLLDISRITKGDIKLCKEQIQVADVIRNALEICRPLIDKAEHKLTVTIPATSLIIDADPNRIVQVFTNLINNAAKYSEPCSRIVITVKRQENNVVVSVEDTGIGIPKEALSSIFDVFKRGGPESVRYHEGLGIGLTLARKLVELHGGHIDVKSQVGKGSEFVVYLPLSTASTCYKEQQGHDQIDMVPQTRVLVVDDNQDLANCLGMLLEVIGVEVKIAYDAKTALDLFSSYMPTLVLMDIGMPGMDGYEAVRLMKQDSHSKQVTFVALTGWGQPEDIRRSKEVGFYQHLVKPVDIRDLKALLNSLA